MILSNQNENSVVSNGIKATSNFNILLNGKAFRVLTDSIYQDKIPSIVREISTNAFDSHVLANKRHVPFSVHIPSIMEPWFSVKDEGIGLSHEEMAGTYTTLFASTKDGSNDTVGAFGLGAKTPFCYTDSFTVIAIKDGMRRSYDARLDSGGIPTLALMDEVATDEHNGLEVTVSVAAEDCEKFAKAVASQLTFFPTRPTILNRIGFKFDIENLDSDRLYGSEEYSIYKNASNDYYFKGQTYIVQGGVGYPLDFSKIDTKIAETARTLVGKNRLILFFNIGKIAVTTSREAIQYDSATIKNIVEKINAVRKSMKTDIEHKIVAIDGVWKRAIFINSLDSNLLETLEVDFKALIPNFTNKSGNYGLVFNEEDKDNPSPLMTTIDVEIPDKLNGVQQIDANGNPLTKIIQKRFALYSVNELNNKYNYAQTTYSIIPQEKAEIFFKDCTNASKRIREYKNSTLDKHIYSIGVVYKEIGANIAEIEKLLGTKIRLASSLPNPDAVTASDGTVSNRGGERAKYYISNNIRRNTYKSTCNKVTDEWEDILKETDAKYYFVVENYSLTEFPIKHGEISPSLKIDLITNYIKPSSEVIFLAERYVEKIKNLPNWIDLDKECAKVYKDIAQNNKKYIRNIALDNCYYKTTIFSELIDKVIDWSKFYAKDKQLKKAFAFKRIVEKISKNKITHIIKSILKHVYEKEIDKLTEKYKEIITKNSNTIIIGELKERYKLFSVMTNSNAIQLENVKEDLYHYINGVQSSLDNKEEIV